ncbi:RHS repeat-associated core domain-containing protein [Amycolatopsis sp. GA6-003]|uniref:RHS repeat-associated core domain-containing protein n=1 Tax=Amycolatopsis sp. GA6-003 TaxID=2652444 RepID=UPI00391729FE
MIIRSRPTGTTLDPFGGSSGRGIASILRQGSAKTSFVYYAGGSRLLRHDPSGTTFCLGGQEIHADPAGQTATTTRYYSHSGGTVAVRTAGKLTWLASDHQGANQIAVNSTDLSVTQRRQDPFGTPRGQAVDLPGERGFVGGTEDSSTGLTQLGARAYDSAAGRFLSLDPVFDPANRQQINGYSYSSNSPIFKSDPTGLNEYNDVGRCIGAPRLRHRPDGPGRERHQWPLHT